jgi:hypothetical protein
MINKEPKNTDVLLDHDACEAAFARVRLAIKSLPEKDWYPVNVDAFDCIIAVLGTLPEVRAMREEIAEEFKRFDFDQFDNIETYTLALNHINAIWRAATLDKVETTARAKALEPIRDDLMQHTALMGRRGLINPEPLAKCKSNTSHKVLAQDVIMLVNHIKASWSNLEGKTPLSLQELNQAANQALDLASAIGSKEQSPVVIGEAARSRQAAFTLFRRAYDEARRAVLYLRYHEGDGDEIAPSLYAGRGGRGKAKPEQTDTAPAAGAATASSAAMAASAEHEIGNVAVGNPQGFPLTAPFAKK